MPHFFDRLHEAMEILVEFFTLDGSGLTGRKLYTDQYHEVEMFFNLNKVTDDVSRLMEATPPKHIFYQMYQQAKIQIK
jgi:hypothetical protein